MKEAANGGGLRQTPSEDGLERGLLALRMMQRRG
jgi:hypothetical protein